MLYRRITSHIMLHCQRVQLGASHLLVNKAAEHHPCTDSSPLVRQCSLVNRSALGGVAVERVLSQREQRKQWAWSAGGGDLTG